VLTPTEIDNDFVLVVRFDNDKRLAIAGFGSDAQRPIVVSKLDPKAEGFEGNDDEELVIPVLRTLATK
jgi:hypothetical protein